MTFKLQIILIITTLLFFFYILEQVKKGKMLTDIGIVWLIFGLALILFAVFPSIVDFIAGVLGIYSQMNTIVLILVFLLICLVFYLYIRLSRVEKKLNEFVERYAIDKKYLNYEELKSKKQD